ncbi:uncharacterized protein B0H18DRAFT_885328 [Fomitopsis serialis]|uniref:uncharacterized protein n=1 Tax=Fomitopsis serialis TaxID=139415 RepID=UPI002007E72E|nr:uncharacterized protein B0H18DRAFT_885328 [Neoantrodia serialis]KAH9915999.1 hypothetical protein B0H18DRAFT_885328 [Neoantrodia serialis]
MPEDCYLCPVRALAEWLSVSNISEGYLFRPFHNGDQVIAVDKPMTYKAFDEYFNNSLVDIGVSPRPYGTHSFRRGGVQFLASERRWRLLTICTWGGWQKDFNSNTIVRYLMSWNDDPIDTREQLTNPNRAMTVRCPRCNRNCHCA